MKCFGSVEKLRSRQRPKKYVLKTVKIRKLSCDLCFFNSLNGREKKHRRSIARTNALLLWFKGSWIFLCESWRLFKWKYISIKTTKSERTNYIKTLVLIWFHKKCEKVIHQGYKINWIIFECKKFNKLSQMEN